MRLYYWESPFGNVGDDLNRWLWPRLFGDVFDDDDETVLIGIGSILAPGYEKHYRVYRKKIVLGAGARSAESPPFRSEPVQIARPPAPAIRIPYWASGYMGKPAG